VQDSVGTFWENFFQVVLRGVTFLLFSLVLCTDLRCPAVQQTDPDTLRDLDDDSVSVINLDDPDRDSPANRRRFGIEAKNTE
jgi:hypothetical protein